MRAFRRKNTGIELVTGVVLTPSPYDRFLGAPLLIGVGERLRALAEDDDERFHGWLIGNGVGRQTDPREKGDKYQVRPGFCRNAEASESIHASPYRRDAAANWKNSAFYSAPARRKNASGLQNSPPAPESGSTLSLQFNFETPRSSPQKSHALRIDAPIAG
jgi:hypothetical protein